MGQSFLSWISDVFWLGIPGTKPQTHVFWLGIPGTYLSVLGSCTPKTSALSRTNIRQGWDRDRWFMIVHVSWAYGSGQVVVRRYPLNLCLSFQTIAHLSWAYG